MSIFDIIAIALIVFGIFFIMIAAIGFWRLPDFFCRMHVTGILDTLGVPAVLLGVAVHNLGQGHLLNAGKLALMIVFVYLTSPLIGHLLGRAALDFGYEPVQVDPGDTKMKSAALPGAAAAAGIADEPDAAKKEEPGA